VVVRWEVAEDEGMKKIVRQGATVATPQLAHAVHVEVKGLQPDHWYFYRFHSGEAVSPVGRARTTPSPESVPQRLRFAFASCQHYEQGYYTAYKHMANDDLDVVIHLGDYIYEGPAGRKGVRQHAGPKTSRLHTLADYRIRHAQYRSDPLLQGMHARCPWIVTWDDHEFDNNYANDISELPNSDPVEFLWRRTNAYQAYYEHMPLRPTSIPRGPDMQLFRTISYGKLATFQVLDTRQYRTDQPNGDTLSPLDIDALNPKNTLLGRRQRGWLLNQLLRSQATWNVLAQQVMMAMVDVDITEGKRYSMDQWPGYAYERMQLLRWIADRRISNPIVLTGDIHSHWCNELRVDDRQTELPVVAVEFVGSSISSGGNYRPPKEMEAAELLKKQNPCVKFFNGQRGYVRCEVTPHSWRSDYIVVEDVLDANSQAPAVVKGKFVVEAGRPGVQQA
jgi:alkaline phosphatase D